MPTIVPFVTRGWREHAAIQLASIAERDRLTHSKHGLTSRAWQPAITSLVESELDLAGATTQTFCNKMKIDDSQSSANYFRAIAELAQRLSDKRIAIYEHGFTYMAFGSWEIVTGRRKQMIRFIYDGKDSLLSYGDAAIKPSKPDDRQHRRIATWEGEDPLEFVAKITEAAFQEIQ